MNTYLATVLINAGEYEKTTRFLVNAPCFSLAQDYAIYCESHTPESLDWSENRVIDAHGEFAYRASVSKVRQCEVDVLLKHLPCLSLSMNELLTSGNYKEHRYVEPHNGPETMWENALAQATELLVERGPSHNSYSNYLYIKNYDGDEIPNGVKVITNQLFRFGVSQRSVLLEQIDYLAKGIESAMILATKADSNIQENSIISSWIKKNISIESVRDMETGLKSDIWYDAHDHNDSEAANLIDEVQCAMADIANTLNNAITK